MMFLMRISNAFPTFCSNGIGLVSRSAITYPAWSATAECKYFRTTDQVVQPQPLAAPAYMETLYEGGVNASRTKQHVSRPFMKRNVQRFQHLSFRSNIRSRKALTQVGPYEEKVSYMLYIASPSQDGTQRSPHNGGTLTINIPTSELARLVTPMRAACIHT